MSISQYILNSREQRRLHMRLRNKWTIRIRWYYIVLLSSAAVVTTILAGSKELVNVYLSISGLAIAANLIIWLANWSGRQSLRYFRVIAVCQIVIDLFLASLVIYVQGGLTSRATVLYAIPILIAGILFMGWYAYLAAVLSGVAYAVTLAIISQTQGTFGLRDAAVPIVFYSCVFLLLAAILSRMTVINASDERRQSYSELLSLLRHELQHPVGVIAAIIEMLERSDSFRQFAPAERRFIHQLKYENRRMHTMITNLLAAGTQLEKPIQDEKVDIVALVEEAAVSCATIAKRLDDLDSRYIGAQIKVFGSAEQLATAFNNIIDNAFRYSKNGDKVRIEIHSSPKSASVVVVDHGQGMTRAQQKHLFERFTKFEQDNKGPDASEKLNTLGLGLYVSKLIVEQHGGSLAVESVLGKGTKVTITLNKESA